MPAVTKHIYEHDIQEINTMWNKELKEIEKVLPKSYNESDILALLKRYYPHEWESVEYKKQYYDKKDKFLIKRFGKARYNMPSAEKLLKRHNSYKKLITRKNQEAYYQNFDENVWKNSIDLLEEKRGGKIARIDKKIANSKAKTQMVTPVFLDKMIGLYDRKNTSQKDKVYILTELMKYYNPKVISFFFKVNDTELNMQLRNMAFRYLQSFNYEPRLRKQQYMKVHASGKKEENILEMSDGTLW